MPWSFRFIKHNLAGILIARFTEEFLFFIPPQLLQLNPHEALKSTQHLHFKRINNDTASSESSSTIQCAFKFTNSHSGSKTCDMQMSQSHTNYKSKHFSVDPVWLSFRSYSTQCLWSNRFVLKQFSTATVYLKWFLLLSSYDSFWSICL